MCEEALSNQVKEKEKKASWETDVNNEPGNSRSKLRSQAPVCFYTHPGLAIKHARVALQRAGAGGGGGLTWGSAESGYVPSWGSRATIPMLGKGVRYSSVYKEKGQTAQQKSVPHQSRRSMPRSRLCKHRLRVFTKKPFSHLLGLHRRDKHKTIFRKTSHFSSSMIYIKNCPVNSQVLLLHCICSGK